MEKALSPFEEFKIRINDKKPDTQARYTDVLQKYAKSQGMTIDDIALEPVDKVQERLKAYFQTISYSQYHILFYAMIHLMVGVQRQNLVNWQYIAGYHPKKPDDRPRDEAYSREQIQALIKAAPNDIVKLAIYCMSTAGLRVGALPEIKIQDLVWIEDHVLYAIKVYATDTDAQYWSFISPQASQLMRKVIGKRKPHKPLFYNLHEPDLAATRGAHESAIWRLLIKTGIRTPSKATERQQIQMDHGFRKFFKTAMEAARIEQIYSEALMGHGPSLVKKYSRMQPQIWLETCGYLAAKDLLTF